MLKNLTLATFVGLAAGVLASSYLTTRRAYDENVLAAAQCAGLPAGQAMELARHTGPYEPESSGMLPKAQYVVLDKTGACRRLATVEPYVTRDHYGVVREARWANRRAFEMPGDDNALIYAVSVD